MSVPAAIPEDPIRLLLVEDDEDDVLLLRESVAATAVAMQIVRVSRLAEALRRLSEEEIDVVITDLSLPDSQGLGTFEQLYAHPRAAPIIVLSGMEDDALALETVQRGAQDYLVKSQVDGRLLVRSIRYAMKRAEAERALAAERGLLRNVVDNLVDAIYVKDLQGHYLLGNLAHARQVGLASPEEVIGKDTHDLFIPEVADRFLADDRRVMEGGEAILNRHERVTDGQGRERWLSTSKVPMRNVQGEIVGLVGIGRDITARKQAEEQLARYTRELQEKNAEMQDDMQMAREVQMAFLPQQFPTFPRHATPEESALRFYSRYFPATLLGGDFFHILPISDSAAGILICDVMGHGVRAALVTAIHRALMEELTEFAADPAAFLAHMNQALLSILRRTRSPMFASAFYLAIDVGSGLVRYANAGHPHPLLVRRSTGTVSKLDFDGKRPGPALGVFDDSVYAVQECAVTVGDLVVLYTDGLYEVENRAGELYDQALLQESVARRAGEPTDEIFDGTIGEVREFSANSSFSDDVCLIGVEACRVGGEDLPKVAD